MMTDSPFIKAKAARLCQALASSVFWIERFSKLGMPLPKDLNEILKSPTISKSDLVQNQGAFPPLGTIPNGPVSRWHQSSGTLGNPLGWGDSTGDWERLLSIWNTLYDIAGIQKSDKLLFPFSFGPFLGFWSAFEAATRLGFFCIAAGGLSTQARIRMIERHGITVMLATPSYALHMAEVGAGQGISLQQTPVNTLILAGEPGANRPSLRNRIENAWGARVLDHYGMTETGPVSMECRYNPGIIHVATDSYICQVIDSNTDQEVDEGELVLTPFDRLTMPLIRYRTGDLVKRHNEICPCGRDLLSFSGGIRGRLDDMLIIRGNNIHPEAIENWLWSQAGVAEFRVEVIHTSGMTQIRLVVEADKESDPAWLQDKIHSGFQERFLFKADVKIAEIPLERYEMKARRFKKLNNP
jgi:phenylacetate-CoA ligase